MRPSSESLASNTTAALPAYWIIRLHCLGSDALDESCPFNPCIIKIRENQVIDMAEKQTSFTVTDRRKFTLDGELRDPSSAELTESTPSPVLEFSGDKSGGVPAATPGAATPQGAAAAIDPDPLDHGLDEAGIDEDGFEDDLGPIPTHQESADQHAEYRKSSGQLDDMIRQANPGAPPSEQVGFEHLVQSFYLSAAVAMGAAAEPGQKPRVDIIAARQSIDMLAVVAEKTKGNLTDREQKLIQSALFNLRMMFLEITNSIAAQAAKTAKPGIIK
jgi:hypothetical protein